MLFLRKIGILRLLGRDVFEDVDEHGAGAAALRDVERLAHDAGQLIHIVDEVRRLRDGHGDARDVDLLKRVLAEQVL